MTKNNKTFRIRSEVWLYPGMAGWHFLSIPKKQSADISKRFSSLKKGWGSLKVTAATGKTEWKTSIFPDRKSGTYLLPLKAKTRKLEDIRAGDSVVFSITIL